ncbi:MAG: ABC-type transporter, integral rane subunit [Clostridiales bacterium]|jgi:iron(III) transport system permease protein|nr:ABC-type transporter, integral rane subunit [Clostridiales bacterium]
MSKKKFKFDFWSGVTLAIMAVFIIFLIYPLLSLVVQAFKDPGSESFTLANFSKFFSKKYYYTTMINSFKVTICVTVLAILIGAPLAYIMKTMKIRGKAVLEILIMISMLSPPFIGAYSWVLLSGRNGVLTRFLTNVLGIQNPPSIYGFGGILLVFTLKLFPFIYLYVGGALKKVDVALGEAAESLGCSGIKKVFTLILPLVLPSLLAGGLLVFMNSLADFGTPMLIGEGFRTMPVIIYDEYISEMGGQANFASALSTMMIIFTAGLFLIQKYIVNKKSFTMSSMRPIEAKKVKGMKNILAHLFVYFVVFLAIIPQITVMFTSFLKTKGTQFVGGSAFSSATYSFDSYKKIFEKMKTPIINTFTFGLIAIIIIIIIGMLGAYVTVRKKNIFTNILDTVTMFPYIIPGSVLGITLLVTFSKGSLPLGGTAIIIIVAFVIRRLPYTLRSSAAILYQLSPSVEEASISLGASPVKTFFKVTTRMMLPGVFAGAIMSWITVITELSSSIMLYVTKTQTLSVAIFTEVLRASYGTAAALSTILTLTTVISLLIFFKFSGSKEVSM